MNEAVASISKTRKVLKSTFDHLLDKEMPLIKRLSGADQLAEKC